MKLHLAGVNHFNPLCRSAVENWLAQMISQYAHAPSFVGVESSEFAQGCYQEQRPRYRQLAEKAWPRLPTEHLEVFTLSLGFEGDAHHSVIPQAEVLWLEMGRRHNDSIHKQAELRMSLYRRWAEAGVLSGEASELLTQINTFTGQLTYNDVMSGQPNDQPQRDYLWAQMLQHRCSSVDGWAAVIVGAMHLSRKPGYLYHFLEDLGFECESVYLQELVPPV